MEEEVKQSYLNEFQKYKDDVIEQINNNAPICSRTYLILLYGHNRATYKEFHYNTNTEIGYIVIDGIKIKALEYKYRRLSFPKLKS